MIFCLKAQAFDDTTHGLRTLNEAFFHRNPKFWAWIEKFIYSEKAANFCKISAVDLSYVVMVKSTMENFVTFSEHMTFAKPSKT